MGRRKTPFGHRLIRSGRIVGWICEGSSANKLLGGADAREALEEAEKINTVDCFRVVRCMALLNWLHCIVARSL